MDARRWHDVDRAVDEVTASSDRAEPLLATFLVGELLKLHHSRHTLISTVFASTIPITRADNVVELVSVTDATT